jgi:dolichol-phosphate mannosyltransferase
MEVAGVSIIISVSDTVSNSDRTIARCSSLLSEFETEFLIVDADEYDQSQRSIESTSSDLSRIGVVGSVSEGFQRARYEYCVVIDAAHSPPPRRLSALCAALANGADIAIGNRSLRSTRYIKRSYWWKFINRDRDWDLWPRLGIPVGPSCFNSVSGFFAVRRNIVQADSLSTQERTNIVLLEILMNGQHNHVVEISYPVSDQRPRKSKHVTRELRNVSEHTLALIFLRCGMKRIIAPERAIRATEFALVGGIGTVINTLVFAISYLGIGVHYLLAGTVAFVVALNCNFVGHWILTFNRSQEQLWDKYWKFTAVSIIGFVVYSALLTMTIDYSQLPPLVSNVIAIVGSAVFNFLGTEKFAFRIKNR